MLKGRQAGGVHRGHGWVFRAESHETMLAWYEDIKNLTEKTGEERNAFVRKHARSFSSGSHKAGSVSSDGALDEDEADHVPYSATASKFSLVPPQDPKFLERPQPGGRFPSDINVNRDLRIPLSPSSGTSSDDHEPLAVSAPSHRGTNHASHPNHHLQRDEQVSRVMRNAHEHDMNRIEHRDTVPSTSNNPASSGRPRLSSYQVQQNDAATHHTRTVNESAIARANGGTVTDDASVQPMSSVPMRLSSFQDQHNKQMVKNNARPDEPKRTMSNDPEAVAAAMALPGSNFPYVQTDDRSQQDQEISNRSNDIVMSNLPGAGSSAQAPRSAQETDSRPVTSHSAAPARGFEYYSQPVQVRGITSDIPDAIAYASEQQTRQDQLAESDETHQPLESSIENPVVKDGIVRGTLAGSTGLKAGDQVPGRHSDAVEQPQSEFQIDAALQQHREGLQNLEQQQNTQAAEPQSEMKFQQPTESATSSTREAITKGYNLAPVELGQFGSSPKQSDINTFEPSFTDGSVDSPVSPMSATIGASKSQAMPFRPRPITRVETVSDLHVPGGFPYSPTGETTA